MAATRRERVAITGIKPSGTPHLGNYVGAIRPALALVDEADTALYFIADYHALTSIQDRAALARFIHEVAATWLALGLDPERVVFYRQSAVPEVFELCWVLSCVTAKGLMNRAHAYKAAVAQNERAQRGDPDAGINMGVFGYPILMAADILLFGATAVPVGSDQAQHIEIARDLAQRFNHIFGDTLVVPAHHRERAAATVPGLDGRKMSKSYGNTIPLFAEPAALRKLIFRMVTDASAQSAPKDPDRSPLFAIFREFASPDDVAAMGERYRAGIGWGEVKGALFEVLDDFLRAPRQRYQALMADRGHLDELLQKGAEKARDLARPTLDRVRRATGID
ncbi:MAG TPA: tryptophan--tRNA ligase [Kofleriaceae bacterium]|nr:tryptophan--tRNA ligase [Kofleriaceae bacterium]